ncbi:hypothetical protein QIA00_04875 (plasmid) [Borreliella americana]|uniref:Uncharacterized protein n=1 Tax=Borreliella americana TaxID=478807 RepID=A0ACD5G5K6_9SPIR
MIIRSNMCILLLTIILFVSCKFFGNSGSSKESGDYLLDNTNKISNSRIAIYSIKQDENTNDTTSGAIKNKSASEMLADASATSKEEKQETKDTLTEEDNKKLMDFFIKTTTY